MAFRIPGLARIAFAASLIAGAPWQSAWAQLSTTTIAAGRQQVSDFIGRVARITGRQTPGSTGQAGYAFVIGSRPAPDGGERLLLVTADHVVRDPAAAGQPPVVTMVLYGNLTLSLRAEVLAEHLPYDQGDVALLLTEEALDAHFPPAQVASSQALLPGSPAWEIGRPGTWEQPPNPGQFSLRDPAGWLLFDGLDAAHGSAGGPVMNARGLIGMVAAESASPAAPVRVVPVELIAAKLAEWGIKWDLVAPEGAPAPTAAGLTSLNQFGSNNDRLTTAMPRPTGPSSQFGGVAARPQAPQAPLGPTPGLVQLLSTEAAARASWAPPDARVSPLRDSRITLLSSPRREATRIGTLPAGFLLPPDVWLTGAYGVVNKLDGGAWFLISTEGQPLGYASGNDVIEIWPAATAAAAGRVVRDWVLPNSDRHATLRDAGSHYDLTATLACKLALCDQVFAYTPRSPVPGAIVPPFEMPPVQGQWAHDAVAELHVLLPRRVVETKGTRLLACIGRSQDCAEQLILGD